MLTVGKWAIGVVTGGIALGALIGSAANPEMKDPPAEWWRLVGSSPAVASNEPGLFEARPAGGYRPDLDYGAEVAVLPFPEYELATLNEEPLAPPPEDTHGVAAAEHAADEAESVAGEAIAARDPEREPAPEVRKSELIGTGLY